MAPPIVIPDDERRGLRSRLNPSVPIVEPDEVLYDQRGPSSSVPVVTPDEVLYDEKPAATEPQRKPLRKSSIARRVVGDTGVALLRGATSGVAEPVVGITDILTLGQSGKGFQQMAGAAERAIKENITDPMYGVKEPYTPPPEGDIGLPGLRKRIDTLLTPEQQEANRNVQEAEGIIPTLRAIAQNPSYIAQAATESLPGMMAGGAIGRQVLSRLPGAITAKLASGAALTEAEIAAVNRLAKIGGSIGEGFVGAGSTAEQVRQQTEGGTLSPQQVGLSALSGLLTSAIGYNGSKLAERIGVEDPTVLFAGGVSEDKALGVALRMIGGAVSEGALQELPQSITEQISQNLALGRPWDEGVANNAAVGAIVGAIMGAGANIRKGSEAAPTPPPPPAPTPFSIEVPPVDLQPIAPMKPGEGPLAIPKPFAPTVTPDETPAATPMSPGQPGPLTFQQRPPPFVPNIPQDTTPPAVPMQPGQGPLKIEQDPQAAIEEARAKSYWSSKWHQASEASVVATPEYAAYRQTKMPHQDAVEAARQDLAMRDAGVQYQDVNAPDPAAQIAALHRPKIEPASVDDAENIRAIEEAIDGAVQQAVEPLVAPIPQAPVQRPLSKRGTKRDVAQYATMPEPATPAETERAAAASLARRALRKPAQQPASPAPVESPPEAVSAPEGSQAETPPPEVPAAAGQGAGDVTTPEPPVVPVAPPTLESDLLAVREAKDRVLDEAFIRAMKYSAIRRRIAALGAFMQGKAAEGQQISPAARVNAARLYSEARRRGITDAIPEIEQYIGRPALPETTTPPAPTRLSVDDATRIVKDRFSAKNGSAYHVASNQTGHIIGYSHVASGTNYGDKNFSDTRLFHVADDGTVREVVEVTDPQTLQTRLAFKDEQGKEATAVAPETQPPQLKTVDDVLRAYDEGSAGIDTVADLANAIDALEDVPASVRDAVDKYRSEVEEDATRYGMRGDQDQYEEDLLNAIRNRDAAPRQQRRGLRGKKEETTPPAKPKGLSRKKAAVSQEPSAPVRTASSLLVELERVQAAADAAGFSDLERPFDVDNLANARGMLMGDIRGGARLSDGQLVMVAYAIRNAENATQKAIERRKKAASEPPAAPVQPDRTMPATGDLSAASVAIRFDVPEDLVQRAFAMESEVHREFTGEQIMQAVSDEFAADKEGYVREIEGNDATPAPAPTPADPQAPVLTTTGQPTAQETPNAPPPQQQPASVPPERPARGLRRKAGKAGRGDSVQRPTEGQVQEGATGANAAGDARGVKVESEPGGDKTISVPSKDTPSLKPKEQKKYLLAEIDAAIAEAPSLTPEMIERQFRDSPEYSDVRNVDEWLKQNPEPVIETLRGSWNYTDENGKHDPVKYEAETARIEAANATLPERHAAWVAAVDERFLPVLNRIQYAGRLPSAAGASGGTVLVTIRDHARLFFQRTLPTCTIEVPGDGTFSIINSREALTDFREKAQKFPVNPPKPTAPSAPSQPKPTSIPKVEKFDGTADAAGKLVMPAASTDESRAVLNNPYQDGDTVVATDGRRLHMVTGVKRGKLKKPNGTYPNWRMVIPADLPNSVEFDTERLLRQLHQAVAAIGPDPYTPVTLYLKDGEIIVEATSQDVASYASGDVRGAKPICSANPNFLIDAIELMRRTGSERATLRWADELTSIVVENGTAKTITMPMRVRAAGPTGSGVTTETYTRAMTDEARTASFVSDRTQAVATYNDLPPDVRAGIDAQTPFTGNIRAVTYGDRTFFVLDRYVDEAQLRGDIREEAGHRLINELGFARVLQAAREGYGGVRLAGIMREIERNYPDVARGSVEFAHELVAKAYRDGEQNVSIWRRMLDAMVRFVREAGRKLGMRLEVTDAEIRDLINGMVKAREANKATGRVLRVNAARGDAVRPGEGDFKRGSPERRAFRKGVKEGQLGGEMYGKAKGRKEGVTVGIREGVRRQQAIQRAKISALMRQKGNEADVRNECRKYIQAHIPPAERGKYLNLVANAKTPEELYRAVFRVDAHAEDIYRRGIIRYIQKLYNRWKASPAVAVDFRERMDELMADISTRKPRESTLARLQGIQDYIDRETAAGRDVQMPRRILSQLRMLTATPLDDMSTTQLEGLLDNLRGLLRLGLSKWKLLQARSKAAVDRDVATIVDTTRPLSRAEMEHAAGLEQGAPLPVLMRNFLRRVRNGIQSIRWNHTDMDVWADWIGNGRGSFDSPFARTFKRPVDEASGRAKLRNEAIQKQTLQMCARYGITREGSLRIGIVAIDDQEGGREKLHNVGLSRGWTTQDVDREVEKTRSRMTANEREMLRWMREQMESVRPELQEVMRTQFNRTLQLVEHYFPFRSDFEAMESDLVENRIERSLHKGLPEMGMIEARRGAGSQIVKFDAVQVFLEHMYDVNYLIEMAPVTKHLTAVLARPEVHAALGDLGHGMARDWVDVVARNGGVDASRKTPWMDMIRRGVGTGTLALNIPTVLVQLTPLVDAMGSIGPHHVMRGVREFAGSPEWRAFIKRNMPEVWKQMDDPSLNDMLDATSVFSLIQKMRQAGFTPLQALDHFARGAASIAAYTEYCAKHNIPVDLDNPNREALRRAETIVRRTQSNADAKDLPLALSRGRGYGNRSVARMIWQFQNFAMRQWSRLTYEGLAVAFDDGPHAARAFNIWLFTGLSSLAAVAMRYGYLDMMASMFGGNGPDDKDKEGDEDWILSHWGLDMIGKVPFLGNVIQSAQYGSVPVPAIETGLDTISGAYRMVAGKKPESREKGAIALATGAGKLAGIPGMTEVARASRQYMQGKEQSGESVRAATRRPLRKAREGRRGHEEA